MKYKLTLDFQVHAGHDFGASIVKFIENLKPEFIPISEERLSKKRHNYDFLLPSLKYCMDHFNIKKLSDIDRTGLKKIVVCQVYQCYWLICLDSFINFF